MRASKPRTNPEAAKIPSEESLDMLKTAARLLSWQLRYRSRFDIVGELLQAAVRGATKTRLMYEAFLSHGQVEEYLGFLLSKKLISLGPDKKHYLPTEKGVRFLVMYDEIKDAVRVRADPVQKVHPGTSSAITTSTN